MNTPYLPSPTPTPPHAPSQYYLHTIRPLSRLPACTGEQFRSVFLRFASAVFPLDALHAMPIQNVHPPI